MNNNRKKMLSWKKISLIAFIICCLTAYFLKAKINQSFFSLQILTGKKLTSTVSKQPKSIVNWHINFTQQWMTYAKPSSPFTIQYPNKWGYYDGSNELLLRKSPDQYNTIYNIYISWGGSFGDPGQCSTRPYVKLKTETLQGCEYTLSDGTDAMQIDKVTSNLNAFVRLRTAKDVSRAELLQILSTLTFNK